MSATVVLCDERDEQPIASSTHRFTLIAMLYTHLVGEFHRDPNVRVACNRWVDPISGTASALKISHLSVTFGWPATETNIRPRVVFDVLTPGLSHSETQNKLAFYEKHGAEEYYLIYPEPPMHAEVYRREGEKLIRVAEVNGYVSPQTGLRFALSRGQLTVFGRDGHPVRTVEEQVAGRDGRPLRTVEEQAAERETAAQRSAALAAKLRELGVDPDTV